uniref:Uncharacterized protein LOC104216970 n=1 Tax=Nicotiana sylvestris TaxID=4096 RepID=A0A1U7VGE0_NICSY|nr:PREDICTED: uncharacterized protein LOC104216970 [Nicotiana sylvestris]
MILVEQLRTWYKFNFDGAFHNDFLHLGISGIIRNNKREWILGYYEKCPTISPIQAELLALRQALQTIIKEKITPCELETDATEVIHFLDEDYPTYSDLIHECRCLMGKAMQQGEIIMKHNFREGNMVAHKMAKEALKYPSYNITLYFAKPPNFAMDVYCKDQEGCDYVRSCSVYACNTLESLGNGNALYGMAQLCTNGISMGLVP